MRHPIPKYIIYDNGSEFKAFFEQLCDTYCVQCKPSTIKNPQVNSILEGIHAVIGSMLRTRELDGTDIQESDPIEQFITYAAWAIPSTHHTVLGSTPAAAIFGQYMLFDKYCVQRKPTNIKNPQANIILECIHAVIGNMLLTWELNGTEI